MSFSPFFTTERVTHVLRDTHFRLHHTDSPGLAKHLAEICQYIADNAQLFDERCQISIQSLSTKLYDLLLATRDPKEESQVALCSVLFYRFISEYNLSSIEDLPMELQEFNLYIEDHESSLPQHLIRQLSYSRESLPITILKKIFNDSDFSKIRDTKAYAAETAIRIDAWEKKIEKQQKDAARLGELFEKHAKDFNFSGLHTGFSDMAGRIKTELRFSQLGLAVFGLLLFMPSALELIFVIPTLTQSTALPTPTLIVTGIGAITITLLFLYFFRIALRKADSCRAQLMQIYLRMSLCRFIQPYTDYSKDVREKHSETFSKFEALIFSGIVGTTENLPSTFDGLEQIAAIAKSLRGGKD